MKMTGDDYDAVLHHWCVVGYRSPADDEQVVLAMITGDEKRRFDDGRWMMTSVLLSPADEIREGAIVRTHNSKYLLGECLKVPAGTPGARR